MSASIAARWLQSLRSVCYMASHIETRVWSEQCSHFAATEMVLNALIKAVGVQGSFRTSGAHRSHMLAVIRLD